MKTQSKQLSLKLEDKKKEKYSNKITFHTRLLPAIPSLAFDTYWKFAAERQNIFFKQISRNSLILTDDPILSTYKFTNAYRASDRTSQYLIKNVIYRDDLPHDIEEVFFRIMIFKIFNKIETWELLEKKLKHILFSEFSFEVYDQILTKAMEKKQRIYSAAYIMPSGGRTFGYSKKHRNHLTLIERMMIDRVPERLEEAASMHKGYDILHSYPTIGNFLAYQFITDINYSNITDFSEMSFVVPGPGALDGIEKCFVDLGGLNKPEIIRLMVDRQEEEFERLGIKFKSLFGRRLQLIDCQNLFCEVDKYCRVKHPNINGISGRTKIKQKYKSKTQKIQYWYPPKWNINKKAVKVMNNLNS